MCKGWYLVLTKVKQEAVAEQHLTRQGFEIYYPLMREHKRRRNVYQLVTEPLFPRYIFIQLDTELSDWSKIRSTRGCISLVRFSSLPAKVPDSLIEHLKQEESARLSEETKRTPFKPGDRVQIVDGVLANYEGIVEMENSQERITLLLSISEGHTRRVSLSLHQVQAAI